MEFPVGDVEQHRWVAIDRDPGEENVDGDEEDAGETPGEGEAAFDIGGVGEEPGAVTIDGGDGVEVGFFDDRGHGAGLEFG